MDIKKYLKNSDLGISVIIVIGILVVLNFFSYQIFWRWDLTENKDYSISQVSKKTVKELDDIVNIKIYFSNNLPNQYINLKQEVADILDEYQNYSGNKIKLEFIDPATIDNVERELGMMGIPALQFNVLEKDKYQVVKGFLGMVLQYGTKNEVIPIVEDTKNLEYQVTLAIKKLISTDTFVLGMATGNSTLGEDETQIIRKKLSEIYLVKDISLANEVVSDVDTLIIIGPQEAYTEEQIKNLDAFLIRGGSLLALVDGVVLGEGLSAEINDIGLDSFWENYGIRLNHDLVLDTSAGMASFNSGFITFSTQYPFWPKVVKKNFDQENAAVANLESLILPWSSSLDILDNKINEKVQVSFLAKTTENAWTMKDSFNLNPQQKFLANEEKGQKNLAVLVSGEFNSFLNQENKLVTRLALVGDGQFVADNILQQSPDNLLFFQNLVDSLSVDEDLINIRSKGVTDRPLKELSETEKRSIKYFNIFGLTILVIIFGMLRYYSRRKKKFADEL